MSALLETRGLRIAAGGKLLCDDLNLDVRAGEFWCVIGRNGAGKSTLLHTLAGLREADAGAVLYEGIELHALGIERLAYKRGLMAQQQVDAFSGSVLDAVLAGRHPYQTGMGWEGEGDHAAARAALQATSMDWAAEKDVMRLSGGERQRVALATLLAQDPSLLLLDEPTAHQDASSQLAVMRLVQRMAAPGSGKAAIAACHDINLVARHATHVLVMVDGRHWLGPAQDVLTPAILQQAFGCAFDVVPATGGKFFIPL